MATEGLRSAFEKFCKHANVAPRSLLDHWGAEPYIYHSQDYTYDISFAEYELWAAPYLQSTLGLQNSHAKVETPPAQTVPQNQSHLEISAEEQMCALFDAVTVETLEKMFPAEGKWQSWSDRSSRNGLSVARMGRAQYNPYKAAIWFLTCGVPGWTWHGAIESLQTIYRLGRVTRLTY